MAESFGCAASNLLCPESFDCNDNDELGVSPQNNEIHEKNSDFAHNGSESLMGFEEQSEERVRVMIEGEREQLPKDDYLKRLRSGVLDLSVRREALDWILKAHAHYSFGPLTACLSMNYLDRFLSVYEFPSGKTWTMQLLAVSCLSLAAKMDETKVPQSVDLQVGEPKFVFEAKTIQRMELLVLRTLNWRMQAFTPCSYIDYFLSKINDDLHPSKSLLSKSVQIILSTIKGIDFLEFRPSEIAAAVAISVSKETQADKATSCFIHVQKERVMKCLELIQDLGLISGCGANVRREAASAAASVPQSPSGVLDTACLSSKSDDLTVGSCPNSSQNIISCPDTKRRKPDSSNL